MIYLILICIYLACCVLSYGLMFAFFKRAFPTVASKMHREHLTASLIPALTGPIGLLAAVLFLCCEKVYFKYGLKFK